ncbi:hypothetical protein CEUSTIGMA_g4879.t1 [Chlamydomonas eustigma]|uniref:Glutamyl-tRNA(Gln) amidotransferase subunit A, chloroplastic/mitochondrial n=1 Tax=Chlamydomonas eustigma TaxID=1157962 RepID=A0A250X2W9_9CHLO|nr:hypothetical protein CEUSTIGMA_g4879.t1 [Chlamydomonas eustigma]|eukprot:GAX77434.1 hypothetical protein CEUSTIGMA_g4879.t1 [Chlamydomonas eustigma]
MMHKSVAFGFQRSFRTRPFIGERCNTSASSSKKTSVIKTLQNEIKEKSRSAADVTQHYLETIARMEPVLNSYISINSEDALAQAHALDSHIAKEGTASLPPLAGIPIAIKDNICTRGLRTTAGSQILRDFLPKTDATAIARLRQAGAIIIGKTNMDEFGMGSSTENSSYKPTRNPCDPERVPGGSSGGSAAAVAAHECAAALGSDTGGSIRQPAHFCGVVGLKPTYGRVSRSGLIAYASSLDVIGPMASSVEDCALLLNAIAGQDPLDSTSSSQPVPDFTQLIKSASTFSSKPLAGKRLGLVTQTLGQGVDPEVEVAIREAARHLESLGAVVEEVPLPNSDLGLPAYYVLALSEASSNLSRYDGVRYGARVSPAGGLGEMYTHTRGQGLGPEVKRRILMGYYALSAGYYDAYYKQAQQVRTLVREEMLSALSQYDALVTPTAPSPAYKVGEKSSDPLAMYKGDLMTVNVNLSGLPAIVVPCGSASISDGSGNQKSLPIGLQIIGRAFGEVELLEIAHTYEQTSL